MYQDGKRHARFLIWAARLRGSAEQSAAHCCSVWSASIAAELMVVPGQCREERHAWKHPSLGLAAAAMLCAQA